jgi:hypothetical protein
MQSSLIRLTGSAMLGEGAAGAPKRLGFDGALSFFRRKA